MQTPWRPPSATARGPRWQPGIHGEAHTAHGAGAKEAGPRSHEQGGNRASCLCPLPRRAGVSLSMLLALALPGTLQQQRWWAHLAAFALEVILLATPACLVRPPAGLCCPDLPRPLLQVYTAGHVKPLASSVTAGPRGKVPSSAVWSCVVQCAPCQPPCAPPRLPAGLAGPQLLPAAPHPHPGVLPPGSSCAAAGFGTAAPAAFGHARRQLGRLDPVPAVHGIAGEAWQQAAECACQMLRLASAAPTARHQLPAVGCMPMWISAGGDSLRRPASELRAGAAACPPTYRCRA